MTKRLENSPTAKSRIREYISDRGLAVRAVEIQCGYSNGFLSAGGEIGSDRLAMFVKNYPDADLDYIITGRHSPERRDDHSNATEKPKVRVMLELELSIDEFIRFGLKDKVVKFVNIE